MGKDTGAWGTAGPAPGRLNSQDIFFLGRDDRIDGLDILVRHLLDLFLAFALDVLRDLGSLLGLLELVDSSDLSSKDIKQSFGIVIIISSFTILLFTKTPL